MALASFALWGTAQRSLHKIRAKRELRGGELYLRLQHQIGVGLRVAKESAFKFGILHEAAV